MNIFDPYKVEISGTNLVEASAGTGKTYSISTLFLRTLLERSVTDIGRIVVVTFTNAAANELKIKIRDKLKYALSYFQFGIKPLDDNNLFEYLRSVKNTENSIEILKLGISNFDLASIFTIHSFCLKLLKDFTTLKISNRNFEMVKNDLPLIKMAAEDFWRQDVVNSDEITDYGKNIKIETLVKIAGIINKKPFIKFKNFDDRPHSIVFKKFADKFPHIQKLLRYDNRLTTFDEIITGVAELLKHEDSLKKIQSSFDIGFVDEFQDTDPIQFEIFQKIFGEKTFFMIGDPKQAIYSFRGGDIFTYQKASEYARKKYTLHKSYRFENKLNSALNNFFMSNRDSFFFDFIKFNPSDFGSSKTSYKIENPLEIILADEENHIVPSCNFITGEILKLKNKNIDIKDVAILVRTNKHAEDVKNTLNSKGVKAVVFSGSNIFGTFEAREIYSILKAIVHPNVFNLKTAIVTRALDRDFSNIETDINNFAGYKDILASKGVFTVFSEIFKDYSAKSKLLSQTDGLRILTNYQHLIEMCENIYAKEHKSPSQILKWIKDKIASQRGDEEEEIRLESDMDALKVLTLHRSKGLEFKVVFVMLDKDGSKINKTTYYETYNESGDTFLDFSEKKIFESKSFIESFAEDLRLYYVGLTRGMAKTYLIFPKSNFGTKYSALNYLLFGRDNKDFNVTPDENNIPEQIKRLKSPATDVYCQTDLKTEKLTNTSFKKFQGNIKTDFVLTSYSQITNGIDYYDEIEDFEDTETSFELPAMSLPKGVNTGLFYHNLMENVDFSEEVNENQVIDIMDKFKIDSSLKDIVVENLKTVFSKNLKGHFTLKNLSAEKISKEFEFVFSVKQLENFFTGLRTIYEKNGKNSYIRLLDKLFIDYKQDNVFIKGYIDLFFCHEGKYYILDWKTNYLGNKIEDFTSENLQKTICSSFYFLQYSIYTFAAVKYLESRIENFSPDQFGGIFYIFMRGINAENDAGIFFDNFNTESLKEIIKYV